MSSTKSKSKYRIPSDSDENDSTSPKSNNLFLVNQKRKLPGFLNGKFWLTNNNLDSPITVPVMFKGVRSHPKHVCILCDQSFSAWKELFAHLSTEWGVNVFACLKCSVGFLSWTALREHEKSTHFGSKNVQNTELMLDIIGHVLVCGDCGIHVVVIANPFGVVKANFDALKDHCSGNFRKLSFYSWSTSVKEYLGKCSVPKSLNIRIKFIPYLVGVPTKCKECSMEMLTYDQMEDHAFMKHSSECVFKSCTICSKNFSNDFTYDTHTIHSHMSERYFLLEFLSSYSNTPPFVAAGFKYSDRLRCDLCAKNIPLNEFNKHDCAVNYTRRLETEGLVVKCPSVILKDFYIDLSLNNSVLTSSVGNKFAKKALVTLKYAANIGLESLDVIKSKEYWSCRCCELIFDKTQTFANHLANFHRLQLKSASFSVTDKIFLLQYGDIVPVCDDGVVCPKSNCGAVFCSVPAVEWHLKVKHSHEFAHYTSLRSASSLIEPPSLLPMTSSEPDTIELGVKRTKPKPLPSNVSIANVFSLAGGPKKTSSVSSKPLPSVAPKQPSTSSLSSSSTPPDNQTVLLHPPPIPNMKPGLYNFIVTRKTNPLNGQPKVVGMFQSLEHVNINYLVDPSQIEALVNVAGNGRTKFAVGCIPSNFKLPEGIKGVPHLPVLPVSATTSFINGQTDSPVPPAPNPFSSSSHWECPICSIKSSDVDFLRNHLKETHTHLCSRCGACFVTIEHESIHRSMKNCPIIKPNSIYVCAKCPVAFELLRDYYAHLIDNHQTDVSFDETTGQVYPSCNIQLASQMINAHPADPSEVSIVDAITVRNVSSTDLPLVNHSADADDVTVVEEGNTSGAKRKADDEISGDVQALKRVAIVAEADKSSTDAVVDTGRPEETTKCIDTVDGDKSFNIGADMDDSETSSSCSSDVTEDAAEKSKNGAADPPLDTSGTSSAVAATDSQSTHDTSYASCQTTLVSTDDSQPKNSQESEIIWDNNVEAKSEIIPKDNLPSVSEKQPTKNYVVDDEIEILSSDDDSGPSVSRPKSIPCSMCSRLFRTQRAVDEHKRSHMYDAGATSELSLPVPFYKDVYVCRLCCLAYERYETFQMHVKKHGTVLACTRCTAVSLSMDLLQSHINAHDSGKLVFGCTTCHSAMRSEKNLLLHMYHEHNCQLLWNCQKCSKANTNWGTMAMHVAQEHKQDLHNITSIVLPCAHCKLHYQPDNIAEYKNPVAMQNFAVGECPHRTFSAYSETLVGCPKCGSMIAATKYLLENEELRKEGQFKLFLVEESVEKKEEARHPAFFNSNPTDSSFRNASMVQNANIIRGMLDKPSPFVASGNKVVIPSNVYVSQNNAVMRKTTLAPSSMVTSTAANVHNQPSTSSSNYCQICRVNYTSQAALKVHLMKHDSVNVIFCLECGFSSKSAYNFYYHLLLTHGAKLKGNILCVCQNCGENMNDLDAYLKHDHIGLHRCDACGIPNYSRDALADHTWRHTKFGPHCCPFCSACFDTAKSMEVHRIRHACENWVMCRECGMCYKNMDQLEKHYVGTHLAQGMIQNKSRCHLCGESINQMPLFHLLSRHTVFAVRLKQSLQLPTSFETSKPFDVTYLDMAKYREIYVCQHCAWIAYDTDGARMHARTSHASGNFWTVLVSPMVARVSPIVTGRCSYCNFSSGFQAVMDHLQINHFQIGRFICDICEESFDSPFDRDYHCLFNHGKRSIESSVHDMHAFSPLNCPLCGIFVADSLFLKHLSSHTLTAGPIGHVVLEICSVCGMCFVNKSEAVLNIHANSHKKNVLEVLLAQKRIFYKFRAVDGIVTGTEPPTCDLCDEILMWNAPMMISHVVQKHFRTSSESLWKYHRSHHKDVVATGGNCRMCIFLNIADTTPL